jgi:signal transduction histidine kinase
MALCLPRVVQETLTNVLRHRARFAWSDDYRRERRAERRDDGVGFVVSERTKRWAAAAFMNACGSCKVT